MEKVIETRNRHYTFHKTPVISSQHKRLSWTHQLTDAEAAQYTKENIFKANTTKAAALIGDWNPAVEGATSIKASHHPVLSILPNLIADQVDPPAVTFTVAQISHVRLSKYDLHGREVARFILLLN